MRTRSSMALIVLGLASAALAQHDVRRASEDCWQKQVKFLPDPASSFVVCITWESVGIKICF